MVRVCIITQSSPDLRDRIANNGNEKWYNNIVCDITKIDRHTRAIFVPENSAETLVHTLNELLNEQSLLVYCYSFSSYLSRADICIGFNKDWGQPTDFVIELIRSFFEEKNYIICIKSPSLTARPQASYKKDAITIGVSKRIINNKEGTSKLHKDLVSLYSILVRYWERV